MPKPKREQPSEKKRPAGYETAKARAAERQRVISKEARDIGDIPPPANPERREQCRTDFRLFCDEYMKATFYLPWSEDHLRVISRIKDVVLFGGLFAVAMPRGAGKTTLCEAGALWSLLYGHRSFVVVVGPDKLHACDRILNTYIELERNEAMLADFPEVCIPIRRLEGIHQRKLLYRGQRVRMEFSSQRIVLPDIEGSAASGAIMHATGITGQVRGLNVKRAGGSVIRPSLAFIDDPQTDESAHSPSQCAERERIINGAVLGLSGPGVRISALMPCTVIRGGDLADRLTNQEKSPQWQGERMRMVREWPARTDLWEKYAELRRDVQRRDGDVAATAACRAFYEQHRRAMDAGAEVSWPARFNTDEISALQHAWNIRIDRGDAAFMSEYQNDPMSEERRGETSLTPDEIAAKVNGHGRGVVPLGASHLTAFIDVHDKALYWVVVAWGDGFTGWVVDYGTEPEQRTGYFSLADVRYTLAMAAPRAGREGAIYAGLERLAQRIVGREWRRDDGAMMRIDRCMIDANWGELTNVVYEFARQSSHSAVIMPSHGKYVGASSRPLGEWTAKPGDRIGLNWRVPVVSGGKRSVRHVVFDANFWKSHVSSRLLVALGDPGCLSLFGHNPEEHRMIAEQLHAEYAIETQGRGRTCYEWRPRLGRDNHFLDCVVGASVAASMQGVSVAGVTVRQAKRRRTYRERLAAWQGVK